MVSASVVWQWLERPGHDAARLTKQGDVWLLEGAAAFVEQELPVCLNYAVLCDESWRTKSCTVRGWVGSRSIDVQIIAGTWSLSGVPQPAVHGCIDVDLNFSPSTNLLPIRRLGLAVGESAAVRAAWLRFPSFELEPLEQTYTRISDDQYRYESGGGAFRATVDVTESGLPLHYEGLWRGEASL